MHKAVRNAYKIWSEDLKGKDCVGDLSIDGENVETKTRREVVDWN
jgi:hypothetical protein